MTRLFGAAGALALAASSAVASTLQFDVNGISIQARNSAGTATAFGGLSHTGSVSFSFQAPITTLAGVYIDGVNAGFSGTLSNFSGEVDLSNGAVTGGNLAVVVNGGSDSYTCNIVPNAGQVAPYVGGGFKIEGLTFQGAFSDPTFGNVNVAAFAGNQLLGSFLQFNFDPNANGGGFADMDLFVTTIPLPPAAWGGLGMLAMVGAAGYVRRRSAN
jgi:hypothetical protein